MSNKLMPWDANDPVDYGKYAEDRSTVKIDRIPTLHLVQGQSPEALSRTAQAGDVVMRLGEGEGPNLGQSFRGIVVARGTRYVWWDDDSEGGRPTASCNKGDDLPASVDPKDILWPNDGGNERPLKNGKPQNGPVAAETETFIVTVYREDALSQPALLTYSRGAKKIGEGLQMLLNGLDRKGIPCYAGIIEFYSEGCTYPNGERGIVLKAKPAGILPPDSPLLERLKTLYDQNQPALTPKQ